MQADEKILEKCKDGDREAFRSVVQCYQRMVFSLALKMLCDEEEAKDAVQDTFLKLWQNISDYKKGANAATWIYTIASHVCLDRLRRKQREQPLLADEELLRAYVEEENPERRLENREFGRVVRLLAEGLSPKQHLVFTLSHLEGLSTGEIMEISGLDASQIKSNLYVARQSIRKRLKDLGYE